MRRLVLALTVGLFLSLAAPSVQAQEAGADKVAAGDQNSDLMRWKLINTAIFALLLGYGVIKYAPKFFQARSGDIQKAIKDATGLKIDADFRYSEVDKRMANLPAEVARLKAEAAAAMEREHERLGHETQEEIEHIGRNADFEIDSLRKDGMMQVRRHTAQLALGLAERRLLTHYTQDNDANNVGEFVSLVGSKN